MAYERKQFALATELLKEEFEKSQDKKVQARKAFLLAKSYDILQQQGEALQWYSKADKLSYRSTSDIDLAYAMKRNERYADAANLFADIFRKTRDQKYNRESSFCKEAAVKMVEKDNFQIERFASNSKYSDYAPTFYENDFLVFTSDRGGNTNIGDYKWNGHAFSDIYITNLRGRNPMLFDGTINSEASEGVVCFSKDFSEMFFTRCYSDERRDQTCKIYYSRRPNGFWLEPEALPFFGEEVNYGQATLVENDSVLIFSVRLKNEANHDLYYSERVEGGWSEATIMPSYINTQGDESFPTAFGDTLYFSSDTHMGFGGLDIFKTYLKNGKWTRPENMGMPLNSGADDFGLVINPSFQPTASIEIQGYFSSSRNTGFNDDIFFFSKFPEALDPEEAEDPIVEEDNYLIYLSGRIVEVQHEDKDPNKKITGKKALKGSQIEISSGDTLISLKSDKNGRFLIQIDPYENYDVKASKKDFLSSQLESIGIFKKMDQDTTINIELNLEKIVYNKEINLNNIYYDFEKWDIRDDAKPTLDTLANLLKLNTGLKIQLSSHTDCRGEFAYNEELSQKRAQSAVDYILTKGIAKARLRAKGYGESSPQIPCPCDSCSEEDHQTNRRTTFKILK